MVATHCDFNLSTIDEKKEEQKPTHPRRKSQCMATKINPKAGNSKAAKQQSLCAPAQILYEANEELRRTMAHTEEF